MLDKPAHISMVVAGSRRSLLELPGKLLILKEAVQKSLEIRDPQPGR